MTLLSPNLPETIIFARGTNQSKSDRYKNNFPMMKLNSYFSHFFSGSKWLVDCVANTCRLICVVSWCVLHLSLQTQAWLPQQKLHSTLFFYSIVTCGNCGKYVLYFYKYPDSKLLYNKLVSIKDCWSHNHL